MSCPTRETLLAWIDGPGQVPPAVAEHIKTCPSCAAAAERLRLALAGLASGTSALASSMPASLEARLRLRLRTHGAPAVATTLRERPRGIRERLGGQRIALLGSAAALALVILAYLFSGSMPSVSAAQVLERSQLALLGSLPSEGCLRIRYAVRYDGPSFGALPEGAGDYRLEELHDRDHPGTFRVVLLDGEGGIVRGVAQHGGMRRIVAKTRRGGFDLTFRLRPSPGGSALLETRRRQIARSFFDTLVRAADPERLRHVERAGRHEVEMLPLPGAPDDGGIFEVRGARLVVDRDSYRLESATVDGTLFGETFRFEARVLSVEALPTGALGPEEFTLPAVEGALRLEGEGTAHPVADVLTLLLERASADASTAERGRP